MHNAPAPRFLLPDWPAPANVRAVVTTRKGGLSRGVYAGFNLGMNTRDAVDDVAANRRLLRAKLGLQNEPAWLHQVHGITVVRADGDARTPEADAAWTNEPETACAVLTADCLPVLLCDRAGTCVAAVHGGWRGLAGGILEATLEAMPCSGNDLLAWLGPAIGPAAFEVGPEVRAAFVGRWPDTEPAFRAGQADRWFCDIYEVARMQLNALGVRDVSGGGFCTVSDSDRFYSYRRESLNGNETGRMASLIWLENA